MIKIEKLKSGKLGGGGGIRNFLLPESLPSCAELWFTLASLQWVTDDLYLHL